MSSCDLARKTISRTKVISVCRWGNLLFCLILLSGCSLSTTTTPAVFHCRVQIDGAPAGDVAVSLVSEPTPGALLKLEGITDASGLAPMKPVSDSELSEDTELRFKASFESLGDWTIREPWNDADRSPIQFDWNGEAVVDIELPRKAVGSL